MELAKNADLEFPALGMLAGEVSRVGPQLLLFPLHSSSFLMVIPRLQFEEQFWISSKVKEQFILSSNGNILNVT